MSMSRGSSPSLYSSDDELLCGFPLKNNGERDERYRYERVLRKSDGKRDRRYSLSSYCSPSRSPSMVRSITGGSENDSECPKGLSLTNFTLINDDSSITEEELCLRPGEEDLPRNITDLRNMKDSLKRRQKKPDCVLRRIKRKYPNEDEYAKGIFCLTEDEIGQRKLPILPSKVGDFPECTIMNVQRVGPNGVQSEELQCLTEKQIIDMKKDFKNNEWKYNATKDNRWDKQLIQYYDQDGIKQERYVSSAEYNFLVNIVKGIPSGYVWGSMQIPNMYGGADRTIKVPFGDDGDFLDVYEYK